MNVLRMCLDKRVIGGVALTAAAVWWLAPGLLAAALPLLVLAICPLSMLFMMKAMNGMQERGPAPDAASAPAVEEPTTAEPTVVTTHPRARWN